MEKAGLIGLVRMRYIKSDSELSMRGDALLESLTRDRAEGLLPFFVSFANIVFLKYIYNLNILILILTYCIYFFLHIISLVFEILLNICNLILLIISKFIILCIIV